MNQHIVKFEPTLQQPTIEEVVADGLSRKPYYISSPKYFYDEVGSQLFDRICGTPEYYLTRTEKKLLKKHARDIVHIVKPDHMIEFGSGMSRKIRCLLDVCAESRRHCAYWPQDICLEVLESAHSALAADYPWLQVNPLWGDYNGGLGNILLPPGRCLALFLGSTIGNFSKDKVLSYLKNVHSFLREDDFLLLGMDRVKPREILEAAYNDKAGYTARFNRNLLAVLNRDLDADFVPSEFEHRAFFNADSKRMEMHLVSSKDQTARINALDYELHFKCGETIRTEVSYKYDLKSLSSLLQRTNFRVLEHFYPDSEYYSLVLAQRVSLH